MIIDTRDQRRALSTTSRLSLAHCVSIYDDAPPWKELGEESDAKGLVFGRSKKKLKLYNAEDCVRDARIYHAMCKEKDWNTSRVQRLYKIHSQLSVIAAKMHAAGVYVNRRNRRFLKYILGQEIGEKTATFCNTARVDKATPVVLRARLFKRHKKEGTPCYGLPDPMNPKLYTDESMRTISVDEGSLLLMLASGDIPVEVVPTLDAWWGVQQAKKRMGTVASEQLTNAIGPDGRIHAGWNSCGTETMRWACSEPNMMNLEQPLRFMFGAPKYRTLVHMDKSQLELRVMEIVTGDPVLYTVFASGGDLYTEDAKVYFDLPPETTKKTVKPEARKASKIIRLASQYMAGLNAVFIQALMQDRAIKFDLVKTLHQKFHERHKDGLVAWARREMQEVSATGYSAGRLLDGRRYYPELPPITEVSNFPIQRTAGEMMNLEIIELDKRLQEFRPYSVSVRGKPARTVAPPMLVVQLHDAFDVDSDRRDEDKVRELLQAVCDREYTIEGRTRRFPVEIKSSRDWSDL